MRKKIPILWAALLALLFTAPRAMADEKVNVEFANGETISFTLDQTPRITYTDQEVTVTYTGGTLTYGMTDITRLTYGEAESTAIESVAATKAVGNISCVGGTFRFEGFPAGSSVRLFNLNGQLVNTTAIESDGNGETSISDLPAGTYVLTVKGQTYKFNKR
jgi:hypothetical protein